MMKLFNLKSNTFIQCFQSLAEVNQSSSVYLRKTLIEWKNPPSTTNNT